MGRRDEGRQEAGRIEEEEGFLARMSRKQKEGAKKGFGEMAEKGAIHF